MTAFDFALAYVLENEGVDSDHKFDRGGRTRYGVTEGLAREHGYDVRDITPHAAGRIFRAEFWRFDGIRDQRVAAKLLDVTVNCGLPTGVRIIQRAVGVTIDGAFGPMTEDAINKRPSEYVIEQLSKSVARHYVEIVKNRPEQGAFLLGWIYRAIRRPHLEVKGA